MCIRGCVDVTFFVILSCALLAVLGCLAYTWIVGDFRLILYNVDSEGNICGTRSSSTGLDLTERPLLFIFDSYQFPHQARSICTETCPQYDIKTKLAMYSYANTTQHKLCRYEVPLVEYIYANYAPDKECPKLPVLKSVDFFQVCIPEVAINSFQSLAYVDLVVPLLDQCFRSVYNFWAFDALAVISSLFLGLFLFLLFRCLSKCVMATVIPILTVGSCCGLGALAFGYHAVCKQLSLSSQAKLPITSFEVYNEIALLVFIVVLSVIIGLLVIVIIINCYRFPGEIDRLFKIFAKFMDQNKIVIWLPAIACIIMAVVMTGGIAAAFCALGLVEMKQSNQVNIFAKMPEPPYTVRRERAAVGFAIVLALVWLPRIVVTSVKLAVHIAASEYLQLTMLDFKPEAYGNRPTAFSLLCTAINISFAEVFSLPVSFVTGLVLLIISPFQWLNDCFSGTLRAITFWTTVGYATQASVTKVETDSHKEYHRAISEGMGVVHRSNGRVSSALLAGEWMLFFAVTAIVSLPICVIVLQMRYESLITFSTPSIFLVTFFGYWIAAAVLAPFSAAFTTFCLNYDSVSFILSNRTATDSIDMAGRKLPPNKDSEVVNKQNEANWERQQQKI